MAYPTGGQDTGEGSLCTTHSDGTTNPTKLIGRSKKEIPKEFDDVANQWRNNKISLRNGAKQLNVSHTTFSNWIKEKGYMKDNKKRDF